VAAVAAFTPAEALGNLVCIGTLLAFAVVCGAVLVLRFTQPGLVRPFRSPLAWVVAPLGVLVNVGMTLFLPWETWLRLAIWLALGLGVYFTYGRRHSELRKATQTEGVV
jgi:APA family basic amino acid/polyamine antiporter